MTHPSELDRLMYVDGALSAAKNTALQSHFGTCEQCRESLVELRMETQCFSAALETVKPKNVPAFHTPVSLKGLVIAAGLTGIVASLTTMFWLSLYSVWFSRIFSWFGSIHIGDAISATVNTVFYFSEKGIPMIDVLLNIVLFGMLASATVYFITAKRELRGAVSLCFSLLIISTFIMSSPTAKALDVRVGESTFTIEADEVINDTVVIAGESAIIDGVVDGDLVVFGQRVVVNGTVTGNLIAFTQSATISGRVEGSVLGFASFLDVNDATIANNLWSFSNNLTINEGSSIDGNATLFTNSASIAGDIARDLTGFGQNIELSGNVGDDIEAFSQKINLIGDAYVGGNIRYRSRDANALQQSSSAVVIGDIEHVINPNFERREGSSVGGKILSQVIRLLMAFVAGMALLWLFPVLQSSSIKSGLEGLKSAGIGLISLICLPIIGLICAITVIGLPFAMVGMFAWVLCLYFAKILVASIIGRLIIKSPEKQSHYALTLLAGLVAVIVVINIPWVGGVLSFVMTLIGVGLLAQYLISYLSTLEASNE